MRNALFFIVFSLCLIQIQAQNFITSKNAPDKIKEAFKVAFTDFNTENYGKSIKELEKIIKKCPDFINAYQLMADCYIQQKNWKEATTYLNKAAALGPDYDPKIYYLLGQIAMEQEQYVEARAQFEKFLKYPTKSEAVSNRAKKMLGDAIFRPDALSKPVRFEPQNMGANINSSHRDYFPSITADENTMIFTVQIGEGQYGQEDLYRSLKKNGEWSKAEPINNVNTTENEAAQSVSADGKFLVFTVCNRAGDFGSCDLYFSDRINGRWSEPKNLGSAINTANWESQPSVSPNADAIYFTRGGARGQGDKNLMISRRNEDGSWAEPIAIAELNTAYDDSAPCIHPDGQTLYFSSSGYPGMGGLDLYVSRLRSDGIWDKPKNLGYPINTAQNEEALAVALSGSLAFIASDRPGGFGSLDIYSFEMPKENRPNPVTYVKGYVYDAVTKKALTKTTVEIYDLSSDKLFTKTKTDADGEFMLCMPLGRDYSLNVKKQKYIFYSDNFALKEIRNQQNPFLLDIPLQPILESASKVDTSSINKEGEPVILKNVFFATNSAELRVESQVELNRLKQLLDENPKMKIRINGHTDNEGSDTDNLILSDRRAKAVRDYLISKGIALDRLDSKGYGESKPLSNNDSTEGRQLNRRTEFVVVN
jgi:outer membrane protein OmpA-like peptidoglycan-associated protein/tetratricopeptide (TPR) repeat protein